MTDGQTDRMTRVKNSGLSDDTYTRTLQRRLRSGGLELGSGSEVES